MRRTRDQRNPRDRGAFTLLELLVVVAVIVILIALVAGAGSRILGAQRERLTKNILISLDRALEEYIAVEGGPPTYPNASIPSGLATLNEFYEDVPGLDMAGGDFTQFATPYPNAPKYPARPDASVFLRQIAGFDTAAEIIAAIPPQFMLLTYEDGILPTDPDPLLKDQPSIIDAWGSPTWNGTPVQGVQQFIYYVHPSNRLAQDLYGRCVNGRPYFMSAGEDKFYGHPRELPLIRDAYANIEIPEGAMNPDAYLLRRAREDNVYSYEVDTSFLTKAIVLGI